MPRRSPLRGARLEGTPQVQDQEGGGGTGSREEKKDRLSVHLTQRLYIGQIRLIVG